MKLKKALSYFKSKNMEEDYSKIIINKIDRLIKYGKKVYCSSDIYLIDKIIVFYYNNKNRIVITINHIEPQESKSLSYEQKEKILNHIMRKYYDRISEEYDNEQSKIKEYLKS